MKKLASLMLTMVTAFSLAGPAIANPIQTEDSPPDKYYCDFAQNVCGILSRPNSASAGDVAATEVEGHARTAPVEEPDSTYKVVLNWEDKHTFGWETHGTVTISSTSAIGAKAELTFTCTKNRTYKFYSDHYVNGVRFQRLEGIEFQPCDKTSIDGVRVTG